jgi:TRAP transporter TAXI family solute receptor
MYALSQFLKTNWWMVVVVVIAFVVTFRFVDPAPPRSITVITGTEEGRYHQVAERLKAELAREGLEVNLKSSAGSIANLEALVSEDNEIAMAFVQSGIENLFDGDTSELHSLGALYFEPIWLFFNRDRPIRFIWDLKGRRIAVGKPGSGTYAVGQLLLEASALKPSVGDAVVEVSELGGEDAVEALEKGEADAAFFVLAADSPMIKRLARNPDLDFLSARRARAFEGNYPFLSSCDIPAGLLDLAEDVPDTDRVLLAALATLVVNDRFHPAHTPLILEAIRTVVGGGGLLERPGEFPTPRFVSFPLTAEAEHYHQNGPPFLLRFMPFWAASLVDRLIILVIPLMVFIIPLLKIAGPLYRWRIRSKIFRWYRYLRETDQKIRDGTIEKHTDEQIDQLRELESDLRQVEVPLSYADELYDLHLHVGHVLERLKALDDQSAGKRGNPEADRATEPIVRPEK